MEKVLNEKVSESKSRKETTLTLMKNNEISYQNIKSRPESISSQQSKQSKLKIAANEIRVSV